jgi:membrane-associated phospholipid phosphatase
VPTEPPWLAAQEGSLPRVWHVLPSVWNGTAYERGEAVVGPNPVAAMPSLHMVGAVLVAVALWRVASGRLRPMLRVLAVTYPVTMAVALVYTGEHYVVDVVAGATLALGAWLVTPVLQRAMTGRHPAPAFERR